MIRIRQHITPKRLQFVRNISRGFVEIGIFTTYTMALASVVVSILINVITIPTPTDPLFLSFVNDWSDIPFESRICVMIALWLAKEEIRRMIFGKKEE